MKTFLGFATGLLFGTLLGGILVSGIIATDNNLREMVNKIATR